MLTMSQTGVDRQFLYAGIVVTGLIGLVINVVLVGLEGRLFAWHQRVRST
jgi:ABC-type nitrate/sulfonate/bicarbonate transport system permease component